MQYGESLHSSLGQHINEVQKYRLVTGNMHLVRDTRFTSEYFIPYKIHCSKRKRNCNSSKKNVVRKSRSPAAAVTGHSVS